MASGRQRLDRAATAMRRWVGPAALVVVGLAGIVNVYRPQPAMARIEAIFDSSPLPLVFGGNRYWEHFRVTLAFEWRDRAGRRHRLRYVARTQYRRPGPFSWRNVFGGAWIHGPPRLGEGWDPARDPLVRRALCGERLLLRELGVDPRDVAGGVTMRWIPEAGARLPPGLPLVAHVPCDQRPRGEGGRR